MSDKNNHDVRVAGVATATAVVAAKAEAVDEKEARGTEVSLLDPDREVRREAGWSMLEEGAIADPRQEVLL